MVVELMKIFVAGTWEYKKKIKKWMELLERNGHTITCDWTMHIESSEMGKLEYAVEDIEGIKKCDIFVLDAEGKSNGKMIEVGIALILKKPIYVIEEYMKFTSVYQSLVPESHFYNHFIEFVKANNL